MKGKIIGYEVVSVNGYDSDEAIDALLRDGYEPYGMLLVQDDGRYPVQAFVKYQEYDIIRENITDEDVRMELLKTV